MKIHVKSVNEKKTPFLMCDYRFPQTGSMKIHVTSVHEKKTNKHSNMKVVNDYDDKKPF